MRKLIKKHAKKLRFGVVGVANTALDFIILFTLTLFGVDKLPANYISTSIAFVFSFFVNRSFTFKSTNGSIRKQFTLFLIITLFGLWVLQPIVIAGVYWLLSSSGYGETLILFVAKVLATIVSLVWNYVCYSRIVFKGKG